MAYDPNYPPDHVLIKAVDFRNQFNALKALIDAQQATIDQKASMDDVNEAIAAGSARNVDGFSFSGDDISDPPQKVEVEDIQSTLAGLIAALQH